VCDSCAEAAWDATVRPIGGADLEAVVASDPVISWGADLHVINGHPWAKIEQVRRRGVQVVIDPRHRSAAADWHPPIRIGTDSAPVLGLMHILVRDRFADRSYFAEHTLGFEQVEREVLPLYTPDRVAEITGRTVADVERLAKLCGTARTPFIVAGGECRLSQSPLVSWI
jgi:anaerobic selenocysteine-containing dehydrogenase